MQDDTAFLQCLQNDCQDHTTRAVYADWLEERGEDLRAEFLRLQLEAFSLAVDNGERRKVQQRLHEIQSHIEADWLHAVLPWGTLWLQRGPTPFHRTNLPTVDRSIVLARERVLLGRVPPESEPAIMLGPTPCISRKHACITRLADGYWIEDLGSRNRTYLGGYAIGSPTLLRNESRIRICDYVLVFCLRNRVPRQDGGSLG